MHTSVLLIQALADRPVLDTVLEAVPIAPTDDLSKGLIYALVYDLLLGSGLKGGGKMVRTVVVQDAPLTTKPQVQPVKEHKAALREAPCPQRIDAPF